MLTLDLKPLYATGNAPLVLPGPTILDGLFELFDRLQEAAS